MKNNQDQEQFQKECNDLIFMLYAERGLQSDPQTMSTIREILKHLHMRLNLIESEVPQAPGCTPL